MQSVGELSVPLSKVEQVQKLYRLIAGDERKTAAQGSAPTATRNRTRQEQPSAREKKGTFLKRFDIGLLALLTGG